MSIQIRNISRDARKAKASNLSISVSGALEQFFIYVCRHMAANLVILWSGLYADVQNHTDL